MLSGSAALHALSRSGAANRDERHFRDHVEADDGAVRVPALPLLAEGSGDIP